MQVNYKDIYLDEEDEIQGLENLLDMLEYKYVGTSAKWMWLPEEWTSYVTTKVQLKKQLRKVKASMGYNDSISD